MAARLKGEQSYIYEFFYGNNPGDNFLMEIFAPKDTVYKLLDEFRLSKSFIYDIDDWYNFLRSKGIVACFINVDYMSYF